MTTGRINQVTGRLYHPLCCSSMAKRMTSQSRSPANQNAAFNPKPVSRTLERFQLSVAAMSQAPTRLLSCITRLAHRCLAAAQPIPRAFATSPERTGKVSPGQTRVASRAAHLTIHYHRPRVGCHHPERHCAAVLLWRL